METQKHIQIVGLLYIVLGCLGFIVSALATYFVIDDSLRVLAMESMGNSERKILILLWGILVGIYLITFLYLYVGKAIRAQKRWATRVVGFILAIPALFSIPIGTAIGLYAIWALNKEIKDEPSTP